MISASRKYSGGRFRPRCEPRAGRSAGSIPLVFVALGGDLAELHRAADRRLGPCGSRSLAQPHMERPGRGHTGRVPACGRRYAHPPREASIRPDARGARRLRRLRRRYALRRRDPLVSPAALGGRAEAGSAGATSPRTRAGKLVPVSAGKRDRGVSPAFRGFALCSPGDPPPPDPACQPDTRLAGRRLRPHARPKR